MTGLAFVDTSLLVYRRDKSEPSKQPRAEEWMAFLWNARSGRLSTQVLNEFYVTVTQKLKPGLDREVARDEVRSLFAWRPVPTDRLAIEGAWRIQDRYGLSIWDSLIVSAALLAGCRHLVSEDLQDGQVLDGLRVVDPFAHRPEELD
jgi:predicted nucleic acid-binding protein